MRPRSAHPRSFRPRVEALERRELLAVCMVDRLTDVGEGKGMAGDLRYCIGQAQDGDSIQFGVQGTINLTRALPELTRSISIEGPGADRLTVRRNTGGDYRIFAVVDVTARVTLSNLSLTRGGVRGYGGGILNWGTLTVSGCTLSGNNVVGEGGGIWNGGTLTVRGSTLSDNRAIAGTFQSRIFGFGGGIYNLGVATVVDSTLARNEAYQDMFTWTASGGGIHNPAGATMTVRGSTLRGNVGYDGGVGGIQNSGTLTVSDSIISQSRFSAVDSGGVLTVTGTTISGGLGSGVVNSGTAVISRSIISGNVTPYEGGGLNNLAGGTAIAEHSTISGNTSLIRGGGIYNRGQLTLVSVTVTENVSREEKAQAQGGGIANEGVLEMRNTILARNTADSAPDLLGSLTVSSHNLIGNTSGGSGFQGRDLLNVNPLLGPLANNGGPTLTHALLPGSPAIDAGHPKTYREGFDQRGEGFPRVVGPRVDIGAFEVQEQGFGDTAPPRGPDVAALVAGHLAQPGVRAGWHELTQVVTGSVRHQSVQTVDERPADRRQTAVAEDGRPSVNGADGGQTSAAEPGDECRLAGSLPANVVW